MSSTATATSLYNQLITQDKVNVLVADFGSVLTSVAVPLAADRLLVGFLIAGFAIDDVAALEIRRVSEAEVAFLVGGSGAGSGSSAGSGSGTGSGTGSGSKTGAVSAIGGATGSISKIGGGVNGRNS